MKNKRSKKLIFIILGIALIITIVYLLVVQKGSTFSLDKNVDSVPGSGEITNVDGEKSFRSTDFGFSFRVPEAFTIGEFDEGGGRVVLVNTGDGESAFQIFISPYDEGAQSLTVERIQEDVPNLTIREPETLQMTGGQSVLTFVGEDSIFGVTREVWMVHKGNLFQIMSPVEIQDELATTLETWELF